MEDIIDGDLELEHGNTNSTAPQSSVCLSRNDMSAAGAMHLTEDIGSLANTNLLIMPFN